MSLDRSRRFRGASSGSVSRVNNSSSATWSQLVRRLAWRSHFSGGGVQPCAPIPHRKCHFSGGSAVGARVSEYAGKQVFRLRSEILPAEPSSLQSEVAIATRRVRALPRHRAPLAGTSFAMRGQHNKPVNADAQGRSAAARRPHLGRGLLARYTSQAAWLCAPQ